MCSSDLHAKGAGNRLLVPGQGHHCHGSFSYGLGLKRSAALQPCPSARPGGARCKGGRDGGGSPVLHKRKSANADSWSGTIARKVGDTVLDERQRSLAPRWGETPKPPASHKRKRPRGKRTGSGYARILRLTSNILISITRSKTRHSSLVGPAGRRLVMHPRSAGTSSCARENSPFYAIEAPISARKRQTSSQAICRKASWPMKWKSWIVK